MPARRVIEDGAVDAPFFANDGLERSEKAGRRLATFKLHAGLDLEYVQVTIDIFCLRAPCHKIRKKKGKALTTSEESAHVADGSRW